jgi:hypothetical protein
MDRRTPPVFTGVARDDSFKGLVILIWVENKDENLLNENGRCEEEVASH